MGPLTVSEYVVEVTKIVDTARSIKAAVDAIAPYMQRLLANPNLIPPICFEGLNQVNYTRNLLYVDPDGRFSVLALVWNPGRESPIHDHENWGVVGTYTPGIRVTDYQALDPNQTPKEKGTATLAKGQVMKIVPPRTHNVHKMGNPGAEPVITIHTYGDRALACRVYHPATGQPNDMTLKYHHVVS